MIEHQSSYQRRNVVADAGATVGAALLFGPSTWAAQPNKNLPQKGVRPPTPGAPPAQKPPGLE